jgi:undecaprenyl-diphosphatase
MIYFFILFLVLTFLVYSVYTKASYIESVDNFSLEFFHSLQSKALDIFFGIFTWLGSLWILFPLFFILLFTLIRQHLYTLTLSISVGFFGAIATTYSLKYILDKQRPHLYEVIGELPPDPSFPSAHTTQIVIFALLIVLVIFHLQFVYKYPIAIVAFCSIITVALSRIYLQVHYLSDVIAGAIIAILWAMISYYILYRQGAA